MSDILGLHDGHNASAAILRSGRVIAAVQEERLTRVKNQGGIPREAIRDVFAIAGSAAATLDQIALDGYYMTYGHWDRDGLADTYENSSDLLSRLKQPLKGTFVDGMYQRRKAAERMHQLGDAGLDNGRVKPVIHHTAHAAAAYYGSGWQGKVLVLTCDGTGDRASATVSIGDRGELTRLAIVPENDSIGHLYSMVTHFMGMTPLEHEYKVMGLAPYVGDASRAKAQSKMFSDLFEFNPRNPLVWRRRKGVPPMFSGYEMIRRLLYRQRFDLIAAGVQQFVEDMLTQWVRNCVRETGIRRVVCSGGVFMNVKANKEILQLPEVDELFIFPSCGDETNSVGAAYSLAADANLRRGEPVEIEPIGPIYWGGDFSDADVETALREFDGGPGIRSRFVEDIERLTAETIAGGEIVARAKGPMEFGARSLGNRAILARPDDMRVVRIINEMIKNRDFWMPFAPSVLAERAEDYYLKPKPVAAPYMILAFDSREESRHKFAAGQHPQDHTVRPQEVSEAFNPDYYRLLKYYEEITGEGVILNTSFNLHGYPIVYKPEEALDVFKRSGLRYLALGNWWVWKA